MSNARLAATVAFPIQTSWVLYLLAPMLAQFVIAALLDVWLLHAHEAWVQPRARRQ